MSISIEEAYKSVSLLNKNAEIYLCFENDDEWVFFYQRKGAKSPIPGDYSNPFVVRKDNGGIKRLFENAEAGWEGFKNLLKSPLTERGYKSIDILTLTRFNAHEDESRIPLPKAAVA